MKPAAITKKRESAALQHSPAQPFRGAANPAKITRQLIHFGPYEVDARAGELHRSGTRIPLREQSLRILIMLLERPGEVALREEIRRRLWPDNTIVSFDNSINTAAKRLRAALNESASQPGYIETVGKRGYRFTGSLASPQVIGPPEPEVEAPMPGRVLGRYEVVGFLGAGGMGEVYRARDSRMGRDVAVKVLPAGVAAMHPERLRLFEQEACAAAAINYPNTLNIFDAGMQDGAPYMVHELLEGETLRDLLRKGAIPGRRALEYARQTANGLAAAHARGIVHRDLKPENLFLTRAGRIKILDFGLAKLTRPGESEGEEPGSRQILGTPGYLAPEQLRGDVVDHRADIFNTGAILYEMLAGRQLFRSESGRDEPIDVSEAYDNPAVVRLLRRCLAKNPRDRIQCARDLAFGLEDLLLPDEDFVAARSPARRASRFIARLWIAAAIVALIAASLAVVHFSRTPAGALPPTPAASDELARIGSGAATRRGSADSRRY